MEARQEEQIRSNYHQQADVLYRRLKDSQSRYWYFWTDGGFRFHPDSGLIGQGGQLAMLESKVKTSAKNELSTNSSDNRQQTKYKLRSDKRSAWQVPNLWLVGFVLAAVTIAWKFRFFLKTLLR
ncbi:MAG: hypothetical protein LBJ04_19315 [Sphingobacterium sp.]|jgi:hypothetical protein|nr:hypothetical protein [Sphingobacterium sp.]